MRCEKDGNRIVMFFSQADLWLAVTIILPFYSRRLEEADWTAQARRGNRGDGGRENTDCTGPEGEDAAHDDEECGPGCWDEDKQDTGRDERVSRRKIKKSLMNVRIITMSSSQLSVKLRVSHACVLL